MLYTGMSFVAGRMNRRSGAPDAPQAKGTQPDEPMTRPLSDREAGAIAGTGPRTSTPTKPSHLDEGTTVAAKPPVSQDRHPIATGQQSQQSTTNTGGLENRGYKPQPGERSMTKEEYKIQSSAQRNFAGKQSEMNCALQSSQQVIRASNGKNLTEAEMITSGKASAGYNPQTGTAAGKIPNIMQAEGVKAKNMPNKPTHIQEALAEGKGVVSAHHAGKLWGNNAQGGHAVHVTGVVKDANGKVTHYVINDTGTGDVGRKVTAQQYEESLLKAPATVTEKPISYGGNTAKQARREKAKAEKAQQQGGGATTGKSEDSVLAKDKDKDKDAPLVDRDDGEVSLGGKNKKDSSEQKSTEGDDRESSDAKIQRQRRIEAAKIKVKGDTLLIGEGDFSLARSLAEQTQDGKRKNIFATSYEPLSQSPHSSSPANIKALQEMGTSVKGGVDATDIQGTFGDGNFDTIAWHFPHAKVPRRESAGFHRKLLHGFFGSAKQVINQDGQIRVTMVDSPHYKGWRIGEQADAHGFEITESHRMPYSEFQEAYPGYGHQQTSSNQSAFSNDDRPTVTYVFQEKKDKGKKD